MSSKSNQTQLLKTISIIQKLGEIVYFHHELIPHQTEPQGPQQIPNQVTTKRVSDITSSIIYTVPNVLISLKK